MIILHISVIWFLFILYTDKLIAHSENLQEVLELAEASGEIFAIYLVPRYVASIQILPIRFLFN